MGFEKNIKSIVHPMAFPGPRNGKSTQLGEAPEKYMVESVDFIIKTKFFNGIEVTTVKDPVIRRKITEMFEKAKLYVTFSAQPVQLINEDHLIAPSDISSIDEIERSNAVDRMKELMQEAYEIGAKQFAFLSGRDPGSEDGLGKRKLAIRSLTQSIKEMCSFNRQLAKENKREPMLMTLELFDRTNEKGFKNQLIGPSGDARPIAEEVKIDGKFDEFGLMYDVSHMHLINDGFDHETVDVLRSLKAFLNWAHVGNSILEKDDPQRGDMHPGMDHPKGLVTPEVLKDYYRTLMEIDFKGGIGLEVMPYGDQISESVVYNGIAAMKNASSQIIVNYAVGSYRFKTRRFMPERLFYKMAELKLSHPEIIKEVAKNRKRRPYPFTGNLLIIAADHPARYVTSVPGDELAMGDRQQYLGRIIRTLMDDEVDGLMTTPDIMDDVFVFDYMIKQAGGKSIVDNKILIGCTNRSGLSGSQYEMDDRDTAYTPKDIKEMNLDGSKMMFRLDMATSQARYSQATLIENSNMIRQCGELGIPSFVEPLPVERVDNKYKVKLNYADLIKTIGVATALGGQYSSKIWLKIPYVDNFELVARATSNPILLLGGDSTGMPTDTFINFEKGLGAGPNIKGALVGRNLLYPGYDDPLAVTLAIAKIIHKYDSTEDAVQYLRTQRGRDIDYLTKLLLKEESEEEKQKK